MGGTLWTLLQDCQLLPQMVKAARLAMRIVPIAFFVLDHAVRFSRMRRGSQAFLRDRILPDSQARP
jgi:hypothetical protein